MKALSKAVGALCAVFALALSASAAGTYTWTADGNAIGSAAYVKIFDDVGAFTGRLRLVGFSTADGEYTVTSNRLHVAAAKGGMSNGLPADAYVHQMSAGARYDGTTTKSIRVQLAQPSGSTALYARITAVTTVSGDHMDSPDLREDYKDAPESSTAAADLLANAVTKIVVGEIGDGTDIYTWTDGETPASLGYGAVRFAYNAEGGITSMTANPLAGRKIVIEGDEMKFAGDAKIYMASVGDLVFSNAVSAAANINVYNSSADDNTITYTGSSNAANLNVDEYRVLFPNRNLDDWAPLSTGCDYGWATGDASPVYNIRKETDGTVTAQRQKEAGQLICAVKFQLRQNGSDIEGRVCYAGYWSKSKAPLGSDADAVMADMTKYDAKSQIVAISGSSSGYGISEIVMSRVGGLPTVRFAGALDVYQILYVRQYAHVIYERAATGAVNMGYTVAANGILTFRDPQPGFDPSLNKAKTAASSLGIKGSGVIEFEATDALYGDETHDAINASSYSGYIVDDWVTVAENQSLSAMTGATALFNGSTSGGYKDNKIPLQLLSIAADGQSATGQFQHLIGWTYGKPDRCAGILVELRQSGSDIQMRATGARCYYKSGDAAGAVAKYGTDLSNYTSYAIYDGSTGTYGVHQVVLAVTSPYSVKEITVTTYPGFRQMVGSSTVPGGKTQLVIKGTDSSILRYSTPSDSAATGALPATNGLLRVKSGGEVVLNRTGSSQSTRLSDDMAMINIEGGSFSQQNAWGMGWTQRVDIVSGEYRVYDLATLTAGQSILNYATFSGGTRLYSARGSSSDYIRAGYNQNAVWTVRGESASSCDANLSIWAYDSTGNTMTFAVNDTGASGSDFIMNGYISVNTGYPKTTVYKTGPGTMQLNDAVNLRGRPLILTGGTWFVNGSNLTSNTDPYTLDGGTLAVADGTENSLGVLTIGANCGAITLGAGAKLSFADSSAAEWAGALTDKVIIKGFAEQSIRFGTTRRGLTEDQLKRLCTSDGQRLYINSKGYLTTIGPGLLIVIR